VSAPQAIVSATTTAFGPHFHILVNNAAVQITRPLFQITQQDYESVYNVNVRGVILMTQACLPHMPAKSRIINISSVGARSGFAELSLYTSSKAALEGLTRSWAGELGSNGTTVNAVAPGPVQSAMLESIPERIVKAQMEGTPVERRVGTPREVSSVVSWLAGEEAGWISGQVVNVSGGWSMY
jgi:3-oxoacyl-[acyl-carrier protein] reductase